MAKGLWSTEQKYQSRYHTRYKKVSLYCIYYCYIIGLLSLGMIAFFFLLYIRKEGTVISFTTVFGPGIVMCSTVGILIHILKEFEQKLLALEEE